MIANIKRLSTARDLLFSWVSRTIRGRYQQSVLGGLWAIIQPAASVAIFSVIFTKFVPVDTGGIPYPVFSYVAVVPWTLFSSSLTDMSNSLVQNMTLVTKIYFPREVLPIAAMMARLLDFGISAGLLVILMMIYRVPFYLPGLILLPLIVLIQIAMITGLGLIAAALNIFYRDVQPLLTLIVQLWFYASPIIYPVTMVPERWRPLYFLNPMAGIIEAYRAVLLHQQLPGTYLYSAAGISLLALIFGYWLFKRVEYLFADIV
ncbi:MAG TPA: ABC transporter permease [Anaerolineales bacterium]|nr:ABC transporter permease [Anaerolineales bacterium]